MNKIISNFLMPFKLVLFLCAFKLISKPVSFRFNSFSIRKNVLRRVKTGKKRVKIRLKRRFFLPGIRFISLRIYKIPLIFKPLKNITNVLSRQFLLLLKKKI
jgi:hypothetical protein